MDFYLFVLIVLFGTAIADLYVGVANDAVNFLNSAIGSKVAHRVVIMIVASLGVLVGTTFSSGMMEVARKGIFNPEMFMYHDVIIIFLAVMITDIILLDLYNTFSLPTSTTVSIVFELVGGATALAIIKVSGDGGGIAEVLRYINTPRIVTIVAGIGLSIVFAFVFGSITQFVTRLIFTFDYQRTFRRYGALYCASALTAITYFILVKGAKGSSLLTDEQVVWIGENLNEILVFSFIAWTIVWQLIIIFTKIQVLRIIVLVGTFALALAFAANDLVNFLGAPLAGLASYTIGSEAGGDPHSVTMEALAAPVRANTWILLIAGGIMVVTLWFSRKARSVAMTAVKLGQQEEGIERFPSSPLSRALVRISLGMFDFFKRFVPRSIQRTVARRLDPAQRKIELGPDGQPPAFDLLRAAVNLMVASALISLGTSLKLPLSTTFVTFMVAMATSLSDRSWGRESAVYRVNGVITVLGGWFFTAFLGFSACLLIAFAIYYGELAAILGLLAFGFYFYFRSSRVHSDREAEIERREKEVASSRPGYEGFVMNMGIVSRFIGDVSSAINECYEGLIKGSRRQLRKALDRIKRLDEEGDRIVADILAMMKHSTEEERGSAPHYARKISSIQIITANLNSLANKSYSHIDNNHHAPDEEQAAEMREVNEAVAGVLKKGSHMLESGDFRELDQVGETVQSLKKTIRMFDKHQMKRIKGGKSGTRQSLLFIGTLNKAERIADQVVSLLQFYRESLTGTLPQLEKKGELPPV